MKLTHVRSCANVRLSDTTWPRLASGLFLLCIMPVKGLVLQTAILIALVVIALLLWRILWNLQWLRGFVRGFTKQWREDAGHKDR